jgi:hypothetical protein
VAAQSALVAKLSIRVSPVAIAAIMAARCDIDLSPGSFISPLIDFAGRTRIFDHSRRFAGRLS